MTAPASARSIIVASDDDAVANLNSIDSWPSLLHSADSQDPNAVHSSDAGLKAFRALPAAVQREFTVHPGIVKRALEITDQTGYIPIEAALEAGNGPAVRVMLDAAKPAGMLENLLGYRNPRTAHTLLMLAVHLNSSDCFDIFETLIKFDPRGLYKCYDCEVRTGNPKLISLLMEHGADPDYRDSDCGSLDGYKTPLDVALYERIPNREACLSYLRLASWTNALIVPSGSFQALVDLTNAS